MKMESGGDSGIEGFPVEPLLGLDALAEMI
jgi:hypothetical protein